MVFLGLAELHSPFDPVDWHIHEMIFGYAAAVITGFLFTAIPNWTGRLPIQGGPLVVLACLWLAGRIIPSFTRNWLVKQGTTHLPVPFNTFDGLCLIGGDDPRECGAHRAYIGNEPVAVAGLCTDTRFGCFAGASADYGGILPPYPAVRGSPMGVGLWHGTGADRALALVEKPEKTFC